MSITEEQAQLIEDYEDTVTVSLSVPRKKLEKLASELQRDMLTLSAVPFDQEAERLETTALRSRLARDLVKIFALLDEEETVEEKEPVPKKAKKPVTQLQRKTRAKTKVVEK